MAAFEICLTVLLGEDNERLQVSHRGLVTTSLKYLSILKETLLWAIRTMCNCPLILHIFPESNLMNIFSINEQCLLNLSKFYFAINTNQRKLIKLEKIQIC